MKKILIAFVVITLLLSTTTFASASTMFNKEPSAQDIMFDIAFLRPLGIVATSFGVVGFVAALPFSVITNSSGLVAKKLISDPAKYTFVRPVGDI